MTEQSLRERSCEIALWSHAAYGDGHPQLHARCISIPHSVPFEFEPLMKLLWLPLTVPFSARTGFREGD